MDRIFSPWRYKYVTKAEPTPGCVFCHMVQAQTDDKFYLLHRAKFNFVVLNLYPYTTAHLMVVPYEHQAWLAQLPDEVSTEMMQLTKRSQRIIEQEYHPDGFNIGLNLGKSAGAGVAEHVHLHVVARWDGDSNYMTTIGETRIIPEELQKTFDRLRKHFGQN